jgi:hypothetical protein
MEDCGLPADAGLIDRCAGIDVCPTVEKQRGRCGVAVFRSHVQERSTLKQEVAPARLTAIEFGETLIYECGISVNLFSQTVEPAAEQWQDSWNVVFGYATGLEKDVYADAQSLWGARVRGDEVIESCAWI